MNFKAEDWIKVDPKAPYFPGCTGYVFHVSHEESFVRIVCQASGKPILDEQGAHMNIKGWVRNEYIIPDNEVTLSDEQLLSIRTVAVENNQKDLFNHAREAVK